MKIWLKMLCVLNLSLLLTGCQGLRKSPIVPAIVPNTQNTQVVEKSPANIIGAVEPIYFLPMKSAFEARIDTGATTSSIDVKDIREFERDGEEWVSFKLVNRRSGEEHVFERPVLETLHVKRINHMEYRIKVMMTVSFGGEVFQTEFTLADREKFEYQALIGRSLLTGRAIVDTAQSHTLK